MRTATLLGQTDRVTASFTAADPTRVVGRRVVAYLLDVALLMALLLVPIFSNAVSFSERPFSGYARDGLSTIEEATGQSSLTVATGSGSTTFGADDMIYIAADDTGLLMSSDSIGTGVLLALNVAR